jgi:predicted transcriptional regulator
MTADKLISLLNQCGISPLPRAKILTIFLLSPGAELTSRGIERQCDLRQPEVSLAISSFEERQWITVLPAKEQAGKGRPEKRYVLAIPVEAIYKSIAATVEKECTQKARLLEQLKAAMIPEPKGESQKEQKQKELVLK